MSHVKRIKDHVALALDVEFLSADDPSGLLMLDAESDLEGVAARTDIARLDNFVAETISSHERYDTAMDKNVAIDLHKCLALSRRQAADRRLWAWLCCIKYPEFVAYRWKPRVAGEHEGLRSPARFIGDNVRNTFARLWWAAELTVVNGTDYSLTEELLALDRFQDGYEAMFGRAFCQYPDALRAFIQTAGQKPQKVIRETSKEFCYLMTTLVLETMTSEQLSEVLADISEKV
ncbi:MAG: hypothetical protein K0U72_11835 [Gammaproteobacteria bacterium]|nr:hypothetical protein [Gammaproteobacteria bacterium]